MDKLVNVQACFNANFCSLLEYHLSNAFGKLDDKVLKYFWCDGISEPLINQEFNSRNITSINKITTQAWIGSTGQDQYIMIIKLGRHSRKRALEGLDLSSCLPKNGQFDWFDIDLLNRTITIQLN